MEEFSIQKGDKKYPRAKYVIPEYLAGEFRIESYPGHSDPIYSPIAVKPDAT